MAREVQKRASGFSGGRGGAGGGVPPKGALLGGGGIAMLVAGGLLVQSSLFNGESVALAADRSSAPASRRAPTD